MVSEYLLGYKENDWFYMKTANPKIYFLSRARGGLNEHLVFFLREAPFVFYF